jgi:hypothetical protein
LQRVRVTGLAAMTGTAAITMRASKGVSQIALDAPLPAGTNSIGVVDTEFPLAAALADGQANSTTPTAGAAGMIYNPQGATWDRLRNNFGVSVEASSAKTATGQSAAAINNFNARGAAFIVNVSAASGTTPTLAVRLQVQDIVSANWVDVPGAVTASITGISTVMLTVYPGVVEAVNAKVSFPLPRVYRFAWTIGGTTPSFTFSIGAHYIN